MTDSTNPFPGQSRILDELSNGPKRRRVGFEISGSPAREGCKVFDSGGVLDIGEDFVTLDWYDVTLTCSSGVITSGIPSPSLGTNIAMGYVANGYHKKGTSVMVEVRRRMREAVVRPMPFVTTRYYK